MTSRNPKKQYVLDEAEFSEKKPKVSIFLGRETDLGEDEFDTSAKLARARKKAKREFFGDGSFVDLRLSEQDLPSGSPPVEGAPGFEGPPSASAMLLRVLLGSAVNHSHLRFVLEGLQSLSLVPRNSPTEAEASLPRPSSSEENCPASSLTTVTVSADAVGIWEASFKSLDSLSQSPALFSMEALSKPLEPEILSQSDRLRLGRLELTNVTPLLQEKVPSFDRVSQLLSGLDEGSVSLIDRVKRARLGESGAFCETCGAEISSSLFSFFVG